MPEQPAPVSSKPESPSGIDTGNQPIQVTPLPPGFNPAPVPVSPQPAPTPTPAPAAETSSTTTALVAGGIGAAGIIAGILVGIFRK